MSNILFRAQTRRKGERVCVTTGIPVPSKWVYGGVFPCEGSFSIIYQNDPLEKVPVYTDTLGQFTGLTLNGVKVFDGDILTDSERYVLVKWDERKLQWYVIDQKTRWSVRLMCIAEDHKHQWCVCGNRWDNPEMLCQNKSDNPGLSLHTLLCNREFDVNANYRIYKGVHDDGGELLWDSKTDGKISCDDLTGYNITYITTDSQNSDLIIEVS